jgi:hypothetical protein
MVGSKSMGTTPATEAELREALEAMLRPVGTMLNTPWTHDPLGVRAKAAGAVARAVNRLLVPAQPGVQAFERLRAFVDATIKVEAQRIQHAVDPVADAELEDERERAGEFLIATR